MKKIKYILLAITVATAIILSTLSASAAGLKDSVAIGSWIESYKNYNCYAYALGLTDKSYGPGEFAYGACTFAYADTIAKIASDVKADLMSTGTNGLNNKCVKMTTVCPTSVPTGYSCICVRKGTNSYRSDYHFMKYDNGSWYHKPGGTQPLRYLRELSSTQAWTNECVNASGYHESTISYTGTIYYFTYAAEHTYSESWTGKDYHANDENSHYYEFKYTCSNCGDSYTEWSSVPCRGGNYCITPWNLRNEPMAA